MCVVWKKGHLRKAVVAWSKDLKKNKNKKPSLQGIRGIGKGKRGDRHEEHKRDDIFDSRKDI